MTRPGFRWVTEKEPLLPSRLVATMWLEEAQPRACPSHMPFLRRWGHLGRRSNGVAPKLGQALDWLKFCCARSGISEAAGLGSSPVW